MINKAIIYLLFFSTNIFATGFNYPKPGDKLIEDELKENHYTLAKQEDTLLDIARDFDIGQNEILLANPMVDRWLPGEGVKIKIPNRRILPDTPHVGMVLNLPEFRLYYYPKQTKGQRLILTHPISVGRIDWETPLGKTSIIAKNRNPVWRPPQSIKNEHAAKGEILPDVFPAGPDNPLGLYAMRLGVPGYLIHSTNKPYGVGMRVSHGCVRMYPEDIEQLFPQIKIGTPVYIVNQPIKVGWSENQLYIEVHPELEGNEIDYEEQLSHILDLIEKENNQQLPVIDGKALRIALQEKKGIPIVIYKRNFLVSAEEGQ